MTSVAVIGLGATGSHVARQLRSASLDTIFLHDVNRSRQRTVVDALGSAARPSGPDGADAPVVVLAGPSGTHLDLALPAVERGASVVSVADDPDDIDALLGLDGVARRHGQTVVVGAGFAPGLSCLLVRHAANWLDSVEEIAVAKVGTGGPACARQHHRALKTAGRNWIDGEWVLRPGGSGRDLAWFPEPIGARDCYRGALASPVLLRRSFTSTSRISARVSATRRDRITSRLPMLRRPHPDGGPGAIRVEVRGHRRGAFETLIYGVMDHPSVAAGAVAAVTALHLVEGLLPSGALGLSETLDPLPILRDLHHRGVRAATFEGSASGASSAPIGPGDA